MEGALHSFANKDIIPAKTQNDDDITRKRSNNPPPRVLQHTYQDTFAQICRVFNKEAMKRVGPMEENLIKTPLSLSLSLKVFLSKRRALDREKIYLDDDLTLPQVAHCKENMPRVLDARGSKMGCI